MTSNVYLTLLSVYRNFFPWVLLGVRIWEVGSSLETTAVCSSKYFVFGEFFWKKYINTGFFLVKGKALYRWKEHNNSTSFFGNRLAERAEGETETTAQTESHEEGIGPRVRINKKD